ncbi:hypothetical protein GLYMA_02G179201v4 [Glycine max]|nr:hypothetical protein GLYMA_02G179201v4 [Glycine max]KAH1060890.1 hypothetical protein GYH30_004390 [Glycine max]
MKEGINMIFKLSFSWLLFLVEYVGRQSEKGGSGINAFFFLVNYNLAPIGSIFIQNCNSSHSSPK